MSLHTMSSNLSQKHPFWPEKVWNQKSSFLTHFNAVIDGNVLFLHIVLIEMHFLPFLLTWQLSDGWDQLPACVLRWRPLHMIKTAPGMDSPPFASSSCEQGPRLQSNSMNAINYMDDVLMSRLFLYLTKIISYYNVGIRKLEYFDHIYSDIIIGRIAKLAL